MKLTGKGSVGAGEPNTSCQAACAAGGTTRWAVFNSNVAAGL